MKLYSLKELEALAIEQFKNYPNEKQLFASSDGQFFFEENRANLHAKAKDLTVYPFRSISANDTDKIEDVDVFADLNAKECIKLINDQTDPLIIEQWLEVEKKGKQRATVVSAIESKTKAITEEKAESPKTEDSTTEASKTE